MTFEQICAAFKADSKGRNSVKCRCPTHNDEKCSLSISKSNDGKTLIHCHAGCQTAEVLKAVGLTMEDLRESKGSRNNGSQWREYVEHCISRKKGRQLRVEATYDYADPVTGAYTCTKVRLTGKEMVYGRVEDGRFEWGLKGHPKGIFTESVEALKEAAASGNRVYYAEGEKDVVTLQSHGYTAVTAGGASDWKKDYSELFKGAEAVICADNDEPGLKLADQIKHDLLGIAKTVTVIVPVPDIEKADITDFFERGGTDEELQELIEKSKVISAPDTPAMPNLDRFHHVSGKTGLPTGAFDWEIFRFLKQRESILILGGTPFVYGEGVYKADCNGSKLKTMIRELLYPQFITANTLKRVYDLFLTADELQAKPEEMNTFPVSWICFRNGMYDPVSKQLFEHDPKYRALNQIPHDYYPERELEGNNIERWLQQTFPCEDDREMLLEYIGLCMTRDVKQQKFLLLNGLGGTGKSGLIGLVVGIIGNENCSHVPLEKLSERFTAFELMGKLLNSCADLRIAALEDVSVLKQVLGEDALRGEAKGKDAVSFTSYAKLLFSVNELPQVTGERTNGFYRRLLILTMNRVPKNVDVTLFDRLAAETPFLIKQSVEALSRMYAAGKIAESSSSREAVAQMARDSDTVEAWIADEMFRVAGCRADRTALFNRYEAYCERQDRKPLQRVGFYKALRSKGFTEIKEHGDRKFVGLSASPGQATTSNCPENGPEIDKFIEVELPSDLPFE